MPFHSIISTDSDTLYEAIKILYGREYFTAKDIADQYDRHPSSYSPILWKLVQTKRATVVGKTRQKDKKGISRPITVYRLN